MSLKVRVDQLIKDMLEFAKYAATTGQVIAPEQKIKARLALCHPCEKFDGRSCAVCGCNMKVKVVLDYSSCPIGLWK